MSTDDLPPELWEDDEPPRQRPLRAKLIRLAGMIAILALVLPGILVTWTTWSRTAEYACELAVQYYAPSADASEARFDLVPVQSLGWTCYAVMFDGTEARVASLGPIPGAPTLRPMTGS